MGKRDKTRPKTLYHYTGPWHLRSIIGEGVLRTTESNISLHESHFGPDVVWALDTAWAPEGVELAHGLGDAKMTARVTFRTPRGAVKWLEWPWLAKMDPLWKTIMIQSGGGIEAAEKWWVVPNPVYIDQWTAVEVLTDQGWVTVEGWGKGV